MFAWVWQTWGLRSQDETFRSFGRKPSGRSGAPHLRKTASYGAPLEFTFVTLIEVRCAPPARDGGTPIALAGILPLAVVNREPIPGAVLLVPKTTTGPS